MDFIKIITAILCFLLPYQIQAAPQWPQWPSPSASQINLPGSSGLMVNNFNNGHVGGILHGVASIVGASLGGLRGFRNG